MLKFGPFVLVLPKGLEQSTHFSIRNLIGRKQWSQRHQEYDREFVISLVQSIRIPWLSPQSMYILEESEALPE
jgi:hypothetical protein